MKKSLWTMAAALALVGCSQDQLMPDNPVVQNKGAVGANIFVPATSRGTALNSVSDFEQSGFGFDLIAYSYDAVGNATSFMGEAGNGIRFTYDDVWDYANRGEMKFWQDVPDDAETMKFFAVSPAYEELPDDGTTGYTIGDTERKIDYKVPADVKEHQDLMYAQTNLSDPTDWSSTSDAYLNGVPLNFHHALSQIVFQARIADKDDGLVTAEINSISVNNIYGSGVFDMATAAEILANESIVDGDGTLDDKKDNEGYDYNLWEIWGNGNVSYTVSSDDLFQTEISDITSTALTGGSIEDGTETAMLLIPQELTALDLSTIGDNVNSAKKEQLEAKGISLDNTQGAGDYFEISCKVKFNGTEYIVGSEDEYESIYIPITTGAWNPGFKYIYTLIFSADSGDPVKATVVSVDEWNSYDEDAPNSGDNDDDDDADDEEEEEIITEIKGLRYSVTYQHFYIDDIEDFNNMADLIKRSLDEEHPSYEDKAYLDPVDNSYKSFAKAKYKQTATIDFSDVETFDFEFGGKINFNRIGGADLLNQFMGEYDGQGYEIKGLYYSNGGDGSPSVGAHMALFYYIQGATISNLTVSGEFTSKSIVGGIVSEDRGNSTIKNCVSNVTINADYRGVGGIVSNAKDTQIIGCTNNGQINAAGSDWVGGIVGYSTGNPVIIACVNTADITGDYDTGGIIGVDGGAASIYASFNTGIVNAAKISPNSSSSLGGIVGTLVGTITGCYNLGAVKCSGEEYAQEDYTNIGAVVGIESNESLEPSEAIKACYWGGDCKSDNGYAIGGWAVSDEVKNAMNTALNATSCGYVFEPNEDNTLLVPVPVK